MLKRLKIKKLFGEFDYDLSFAENDINILTGPNGFGKSTILRLIETVSLNNLSNFKNFIFKKIVIETTQGSVLTIEKKEKELLVNDVALKSYNYSPLHSRFIDVDEDFQLDYNLSKYLNNDILLFGSRTSYKAEDRLINLNLERLSSSSKSRKPLIDLDKYLSNFKKEMGEISFIREQRLIKSEISKNEDKESISFVIDDLPSRLKTIITGYVLKYSDKSSSLDSTFPNRALKKKIKFDIKKVSVLLSQIKELQEKINGFSLLKNKLSILDVFSEMNDSKLKGEDWNILMLYLEDSYDKLSVFSTLVEKLCAFVDIINNKLYKKQIIISLNDGFEVLKDNGDQIPLSKLSSGEQQIIVLYYDLIFSIENKTLLLIDEPEISLHVAWQRTFLEDLNRCSKLNNNGITAIVCTHSPQIIDSRWKKIIDLSFQNVK